MNVLININKYKIMLLVIGVVLMGGGVIYGASSISASVSLGKANRGNLKSGEVLPTKGAGYVLFSNTTSRKTRFGTHELVMAIKTATFKVSSKYRGEKLYIGDLSARKGGKLKHHASHQNGRDVDLGFYATDSKNRSVKLSSFVPFDKNGFSVDPPMKFKFDTKRNFELVKQLINSKHANVQWVFVADHLKEMMLNMAKERGASSSFIAKAKKIMRQPGSNAHWDHFHVRIYCSEDDKPGCVDFGPKWSFAK